MPGTGTPKNLAYAAAVFSMFRTTMPTCTILELVTMAAMLLALPGGLDGLRERGHQAAQLHGDDPLRGRAGAEHLERLEVLQAHRLVVDLLGLFVDLRDGQREPLGPQDRGLPLALGLQDVR